MQIAWAVGSLPYSERLPCRYQIAGNANDTDRTDDISREDPECLRMRTDGASHRRIDFINPQTDRFKSGTDVPAVANAADCGNTGKRESREFRQNGWCQRLRERGRGCELGERPDLQATTIV